MDRSTAGPYYQKLSFNLITVALVCTGLALGKLLILPILFAILLSNLLLPVARILSDHNFNRPFSILVPVLATVLIGGAMFFLVSLQLVSFMDDLPALQARFDAISESVQKWIRTNAHITIQKQNQYLSKGVENLQEQAPQILGSTFESLIEIGNYVFLVPIYTFLILFYRDNIKSFLVGVFKNGSELKVTDVLNESTHVAQHYMLGLLIETTFVFTLNLVGFFIIGIKYKVLLALLAALLNLIPYLGMITANILCMLTTLITTDNPRDVLWVGIALALVQIIDNNFGMPIIVGNRVRINGLVTIVGVLIGGALCGVPGMFLAIPGLAVLKIIFDKVPELKPWGILLGDENTRKQKVSLAKEKPNKVKNNKVPA